MSPIPLRLRLSIAALTVAAALGGASLVSSAPAQQVTPADAKHPAPTQPQLDQPQPIAGSLSRTYTIVGYGLIISKFDSTSLCSAVKNSPASRLGVPTDVNSSIVAVNGQPVPQSDEKFLQIFRAAPPLRLLLEDIGTNNRHRVTLTAKGPFSITTNAVIVDDQMQQCRTALSDAAQARATETQTQAQLVTAIQEALSQADPAVLAKALSVEGMIGWSLSANKLWVSSEEASRKLNHPQSVAKFQRFEAESSARLTSASLEEEKLFPQTAETQQQLSHIHALAAQAYEENITVTLKQNLAQVDAFLLKMRRSQISL